MSHLFASGGQSVGASASASVFTMNIQGLFPLRLTVQALFMFLHQTNNFWIQKQPTWRISYFAFNTSNFPLQKGKFFIRGEKDLELPVYLNLFLCIHINIIKIWFCKIWWDFALQFFRWKCSVINVREGSCVQRSHFICSLQCHCGLWTKGKCLVMREASLNSPYMEFATCR